MNIEQMIKKVERFKKNYVKSISKSLNQNKRVILTLQRDQLLAGQTSKGRLISPTYVSDPHFNTKGSAARYAERKKAKEGLHAAMIRYNLFPTKPSGTPNLIATKTLRASQFHRHLTANITSGKLVITSRWAKGRNVERKYPTALGLSKKSIVYLWNLTIREDLVDYWHNSR